MTAEEKDDYLSLRYDAAIAREDTHGFESLTEEEKVVRCVLLLKAEVENGGFDQFFFNSASDRWQETLHALDVIGAFAVRKMVEQGLSLFPHFRPSSDNRKRRSEMDGFGDSEADFFEKLDSLFYESAEDLNSRLYDYLNKKNP